ncbi:flagellar biosynthetic protein FliR [Aestuariivirga sp.]|uniref:flagellar biosynthetic protein FliR n=1 Tax=Aestuariivirga sp. TaxID=2650926 RepID=UPI0039E357A6
MSEALLTLLWVYILVFARFGAALVLLPGLSNARFPVTIRIFFALFLTVALTPMLMQQLQPAFAPGARYQSALITEVIVGLAFGFWGFCFLHASRFAGSIISSVIGLAGIPGQPIDEHDPTTPLGSLLSLGATAIVFATDLPMMSIEALSRSYETIPVMGAPAGDWLAQNTIRLVRDTSIIAVQMSSPFIVLVVVTNLALGLCGKFTPQLQVYFAALGLTILLSFLLLGWIFPNLAYLPAEAYSSWLKQALQ